MQLSKDKNSIIYDGTIEVKFIDSNHSYWTRDIGAGTASNWRRVSGSTTIIGIQDKSQALVPWAVKLARRFLQAVLRERTVTLYDIETACGLHKEKKETAATTGSLVHDWIEHYTKGLNPPMPDQPLVLQGVQSFLKWKADHKAHIVGSETLIYSKEYDYCGQADFIFYKDGEDQTRLYLGDYKTSNGLYTGVMMQTSSYLKAIEEMGLPSVEWVDQDWLNKVDLNKVEFVGRYALRIEKRSEAEFQLDMEEKGLMDIPYQIFEYVNLDPEPGLIEQDFQAFLHARGLRNWSLCAEKRMKEYLNALIASKVS